MKVAKTVLVLEWIEGKLLRRDLQQLLLPLHADGGEGKKKKLNKATVVRNDNGFRNCKINNVKPEMHENHEIPLFILLYFLELIIFCDTLRVTLCGAGRAAGLYRRRAMARAARRPD